MVWPQQAAFVTPAICWTRFFFWPEQCGSDDRACCLSLVGGGRRAGGGARAGGGLNGGARKQSLENCPVAGVCAWPASLALSFTIHYPAWLMHQSGKFDFFAEKGGRGEGCGRRGPSGQPTAWPACGLSSGPDSRGRRPGVEGPGPSPRGLPGAGGQRLEPSDLPAHCGQLLRLLLAGGAFIFRVPGPICEPKSLLGKWGGLGWPGRLAGAFCKGLSASPAPPPAPSCRPLGRRERHHTVLASWAHSHIHSANAR